MNRPSFDLECDPRPCWIDRALEQAARVRWNHCYFWAVIIFTVGLLAWGLV